MNILSRTYLAAFLLICMGYCSCSQKWDDHIGIDGSGLQQTLYDVLEANPGYSAFLDLLNRSGYADDLKSSKNFTLIVPTNQAIEQVKASYNFNDTSVIRSFVGYHIINSVYNVNDAADTLRVRNLRNKYVEFTHGTFDGVQAQQKNLVAANGLYHVVTTPLKPLLNVYNLTALNFAETVQISSVALFDTATYTNWINEVRTYMTTERNKITYFVVDDDYFNAGYNALRPYYYTRYNEAVNIPPDSTTAFFAKKALLRDFIVQGEVDLGNAVTELVSVSGTKFTVNPADIISRHKASNGTVYRVRKLSAGLTDRIKEIKVLGTSPVGYRQSDKRGNTYFRTKRDTLGNLYNDLEIHGHGVTSFYVKYRVSAANSVRYKVYGRCILGLAGDPQTAAFTQNVYFFNPAAVSDIEVNLYNKPVINSTGATTTFMPWAVGMLNHDEVYLGEVVQDQFGALPFLVMCVGTGPIIIEYLRFVPVIQ